MSLNEDCLLKFLLNPDELLITTEILKLSNKNFEKWNTAVNNKETDMIYLTASNNQD